MFRPQAEKTATRIDNMKCVRKDGKGRVMAGDGSCSVPLLASYL